MTYTPTEPRVVAVERLADLVQCARVIARRRLKLRKIGVTLWSEIALPGDADYDADLPRLVERCTRHTIRGAMSETERLPAAWVFPASAALMDEGPRPADRESAQEIGVTIKHADNSDRPDATIAMHCRAIDLFRRIAIEHRGLGLPGADTEVGELTTTYTPDGRHLYREVPILFVGPSTPIDPPPPPEVNGDDDDPLPPIGPPDDPNP